MSTLNGGLEIFKQSEQYLGLDYTGVLDMKSKQPLVENFPTSKFGAHAKLAEYLLWPSITKIGN